MGGFSSLQPIWRRREWPRRTRASSRGQCIARWACWLLTARWKLGRLVRGRVPVRLSNLAFSLCLRYCPFGSAFCSMLWALLPRPSGPLLYMTFYDLFESFLPSVFPGCGFFFLCRFTSWRGLGRRSSTLGCRVSYVLLARVCVRPSECNLSDYQTRDTRYRVATPRCRLLPTCTPPRPTRPGR